MTPEERDRLKAREGWRTRMQDALAAAGCSTHAEWPEKFPGPHCWFVFSLKRGGESCAMCGVERGTTTAATPCAPGLHDPLARRKKVP